MIVREDGHTFCDEVCLEDFDKDPSGCSDEHEDEEQVDVCCNCNVDLEDSDDDT